MDPADRRDPDGDSMMDVFRRMMGRRDGRNRHGGGGGGSSSGYGSGGFGGNPYYDNSRDNDREDSPPDPSGYRFLFVDPREWRLPSMVQPVEDPAEQPSSGSELGVISTDAVLYRLPERIDGTTKMHSVLRMPSTLPSGNTPSSNTFNILMADVSGSMSSYWQYVQEFWNTFVAPKLVGQTRIFTFDNSVRFRRSGTELNDKDFSGGGTELTGALQTIVSEVYKCQQKYVNIFIITDGDHNGSRVNPQTVIDQMEAPSSKVCSIYLLGAGHNFPVQYSIDIRSRLHNGNSNLPSLYWAKQSMNIMEQMEDIGTKLSGGASLSMKLNVVGSPLPGLEPRNNFHLQEIVYFPDGPENYTELTANVKGSNAKIKLQPQEIPIEALFDVFRQWNSVIIQLKYKKERIPPDVIPFMERLFSTHTTKPKSTGPQSLSERLREKDNKREEMEFRSLLNGIKSILTQEKFARQIDLAENILSTSVSRSKYEVKTLQLKGHTDAEYETDCQEFLKVYNEHKDNILKLKQEPGDVCQATKQSTLSDLQDESFPQLMDKNKFEFLKAFTLSGIPVFAPTRDSVTLNPWSYSVQRILNAPYTIMSQVAMETMAQNSTDQRNKEVQAKENDDSTNFNAIVPVFPPSAAKTLQPIVRTRLYAMCATFATLKNPHMIDFNVHMASLGVTWVRCLFDHPDTPRPEYIRIRMESIEATASCYMDRYGFATYAKALLDDTQQALMTESTETYDDKPIKCESIVKPMFILRMMLFTGSKIDVSKLANIVKMMLLEYVGRCISHYKSGEEEKTPYTDFFAESLEDQGKKKEFVQKFVADAKAEMSQSSSGLLESFYTFEKARKAAQVVAKGHLETMKTSMAAEIPAKVNMEKVIQLRNVTTAGDLSWGTLQTFAREVGLPEDAINTLFGEESVFVYTTHALKYRSSKERLSKVVDDYETSKAFVTKKIQEENLNIVSKELYGSLVKALEDAWLKEYLDVHSEVVEPMTPQQIVHQAQQRGIQVTEDTFSQVYKRYRPTFGLLGNACQTRACPYYLQPDKTYNQHASVERQRGRTTFMHALHQTTYQCREDDMPSIISEISSGTHTKDKKPVDEGEVTKWESDIKKLKNIYSEQAKGQSSNP